MRPANDWPSRTKEALQKFLQTLKEEYPEARVYLFGSFARGDWLEDSDLDLAVISPQFQGALVERMADLRRLAPNYASFEIFAFTPEEMEHLLQSSSFWQENASYWLDLGATGEDSWSIP